MARSPKSFIKDWILTDLTNGKLGIECPHCHGKAVVNKTQWLKPRRMHDSGVKRPPEFFHGRACTYCFKGPFIPEERYLELKARVRNT